MRPKDIIPWADLPLLHGEDSVEWNNNMARYSHVGCPGVQFEDNCAEPHDCAVKGRCRVTYEKWLDIMTKELTNG